MLDPCRHCELHKEEPCTHVDGYLCNYETCEMRIEFVSQRKGPNECIKSI